MSHFLIIRKANPICGQYEVNPEFWWATQVGQMGQLKINLFIPREKVLFWVYYEYLYCQSLFSQDGLDIGLWLS